MSVASWDPVVPFLAPHARVLRCDFRGQLLSAGPPPPTFEGHADDVAALLDSLDLEDVAVAGTSFGGFVALHLAAAHPRLVRRLVVLTATEALDGRMREQAGALRDLAIAGARGGDGGRVFRALAPSTFSDAYLASMPQGWVEERAKQMAALPPAWFESLAGLMEAVLALDLTAVLPRIAAPTLVVGAELDRTFPPEHSARLARAIPGARLEIVSGAGHGVVVEQPRTAADAILRGAIAPEIEVPVA